MRKPAAHIIRLGCLVMLLNALTVQPAIGYTLVDWIRTWPVSTPGAVAAPAFPAVVPTYPAPAYVAPGCGPAAPSCETRPPYYSAPAPLAPAPHCGVALPAAPVGAGVSYFQPAVVAPTPVQHVRYRSTWVRVPTTNYRPIVNYDPATGWPTTAMLPCTTYTWQMQRVPVAGPANWLLDPLRNLFGPAAPPGAPAVGIYAPAPIVVQGGTDSPAPTLPAAPAYTGPPSMAPPSPYGTTAPLSPPTASPGWMPSGASAPTMPAPQTAPAGPAPADQPPQLSPNEIQRLQPIPEIRRYPPADDGATQPPLLNPSPPAPPASPPLFSPVPDPDAGSSRSQVPAAPSLYDSDGRTARVLPLSSRWPAVPIHWPERPAVAESPAVTPFRLSEPTPSPAALDTGGWQAVRP